MSTATQKPFKPYRLLKKDSFGQYESLVFDTPEERENVWNEILSHYGCSSTTRHYREVGVIPQPITGAKSRRFRESGASYAPAQMLKLDATNRQNQKVYRIDFSANMAYKQSQSLINDCWGETWPR